MYSITFRLFIENKRYNKNNVIILLLFNSEYYICIVINMIDYYKPLQLNKSPNDHSGLDTLTKQFPSHCPLFFYASIKDPIGRKHCASANGKERGNVSGRLTGGSRG